MCIDFPKRGGNSSSVRVFPRSPNPWPIILCNQPPRIFLANKMHSSDGLSLGHLPTLRLVRPCHRGLPEGDWASLTRIVGIGGNCQWFA